MSKATKLFDLGEDILYLILKQIHAESPASLQQFANASKECEKLTGPILYRSVTLSDKGGKKDLSQMKYIFGRLLNYSDPIHNYVRELKITEWGDEIDHSRRGIPSDEALANPASLNFPWNSSELRNGESKSMGSLQLESALENVRELELFSWDAKSMIPEGVISKLEERQPNAKLSITNNRRLEKTADSAMDVRLLSSPLLYSLNYSILHGTTPSGTTVCSEFRQLKDILVQSPKLGVLSLAVYPSSGIDIPVPKTPLDWHPDLPVGSGEPLTKLHTLTITDQFSYSAQSISKVYSAMFIQSHDFIHLNRLDFRNLRTSYSFEPLMGRVSNLKHLEFKFSIENPSHDRFGQPRCRDATLVRDFLASIDALETLKITSDEESFDILWPAILKHRDSLQRFSIHTSPDQRYRRKAPPVLTCHQMEQLQESKISDLTLDVLIPDIAWFSKLDHGLNDVDLDPSTALALANFTHLERLKIYVELPTEASVFSLRYNYNPFRQGDPVPPLKDNTAKEVAVGLFQQIFITDPKTPLRELEVCFCRLNIGDRMDSYIVHNSIWVRKAEIDYINKPKDPGYAVEFQGKWASCPYG